MIGRPPTGAQHTQSSRGRAWLRALSYPEPAPALGGRPADLQRWTHFIPEDPEAGRGEVTCPRARREQTPAFSFSPAPALRCPVPSLKTTSKSERSEEKRGTSVQAPLVVIFANPGLVSIFACFVCSPLLACYLGQLQQAPHPDCAILSWGMGGV